MRDVFCKGPGVAIGGLQDLQDAFQVEYQAENIIGPSVFIGESTSLSARVVSPINPRVVIGSFDFPAHGDRTLFAFNRGQQRVEVAARDRARGIFNFYLLTFANACNDARGGCTPGDLYTPAIESGWKDVTLQDDEELKNTPLDCRQCHERGRDTPVLLMRELRDPWMHFFAQPIGTISLSLVDLSGGMGMTAAYESAKGDEPYANFKLAIIAKSSGGTLQELVDQEQPLLFDSSAIINELGLLPSTSSAPTRSPTWDSEYEAFKLGEHLALPYFDRTATDPDKLAALTAAYQSYRAGTIAASALPDLADVFPDDRQVRAEIGLQTEPDATPAQLLVQACCPCHNDVLDQSITRARFNVALDHLDADELTVAMDRLGLAPDQEGAMPPREARQLDDQAKSRLLEYLRAGTFPTSDLDLLDHAAKVGMAGGAK